MKVTSARLLAVAAVMMSAVLAAVPALKRPPAPFAPEADARVVSSSKSKNYGTSTKLSARGGGSIERSYLEFNVSGVSGSATPAKLRLKVTDASHHGGTDRVVADTTWTEKAIT